MHKQKQIAVIVPFRMNLRQPRRIINFLWLQWYYRSHLPEAEFAIGRCYTKVFSKSQAVNDGVRKTTARTLVIVDADCYIDTKVIQYCADKIDEALDRGQRLWFLPYRYLFRLTRNASDKVLASDPRYPYTFPEPPDNKDVESTIGSMHGKRYGALIQIMPRVAHNLYGGWDERMIGWGAEDIANAYKLDTLYVRHKTTPNQVLHLWHPKIGGSFKTRRWAGQKSLEPNGRLGSRYSHASGDRALMEKLVNESLDFSHSQTVWNKIKNRFMSQG